MDESVTMKAFKRNIGYSNNCPTSSTFSLDRGWLVSDSGSRPADEPVQVPGQPLPTNYRRFKGSNTPAEMLSTLSASHFDSWGMAIVTAALPLVLHDALTSRTLLLLIAIGLLYWLGYAINDYFDAPIDAQDKSKAEKNFFVQREIPTKLAAFVVLTIGGFVSYTFVQFGLKGISLLALSVFVMWGYSAPPLRFKSRPGLDLLIHAIFVFMFPYLVSLLLIDAVWSPLDYFLLGIFFFISLAGQLRNQIRDCDIDSQTDVGPALAVRKNPSVAWKNSFIEIKLKLMRVYCNIVNIGTQGHRPMLIV